MIHRREIQYCSRLSKKEISWFIEERQYCSRLSKKEKSWFIEDKEILAVDFLKKK